MYGSWTFVSLNSRLESNEEEEASKHSSAAHANGSNAKPIAPTSAESAQGTLLCTGGLDVIRKEAWRFYRTSSGVRPCWELEQPKGPKGQEGNWLHGARAQTARCGITDY